MSKYRIDVTELIKGTVSYHYIVEANSPEEAKKVFNETAGELDMLDWELVDYQCDCGPHGVDESTVYFDPELVEEE